MLNALYANVHSSLMRRPPLSRSGHFFGMPQYAGSKADLVHYLRPKPTTVPRASLCATTPSASTSSTSSVGSTTCARQVPASSSLQAAWAAVVPTSGHESSACEVCGSYVGTMIQGKLVNISRVHGWLVTENGERLFIRGSALAIVSQHGVPRSVRAPCWAALCSERVAGGSWQSSCSTALKLFLQRIGISLVLCMMVTEAVGISPCTLLPSGLRASAAQYPV